MMAISLPILFLLVPMALLLAGAGVFGFMWAVRSGQYEDVDTPALRPLLEEEDRPLSDETENDYTEKKTVHSNSGID